MAELPSQPQPEDATKELKQLAQRISGTLNTRNGPIDPIPGSMLDPKAAIFDARAWTREFINFSEGDPKCAPNRALGVAFQNPNVHGWNTGTQVQQSVSSVVVEVVKNLCGSLQPPKQHPETNSEGFEGVVEGGEMLLVLGPPGAGCSTLLKTLASQTADLEIDPESYLNYRGICQPSSSPPSGSAFNTCAPR